MARPIKRSADYFPHDHAARNTPEVRALRARFGLEGFAIYIMIMELLCGSDNFCTPWDELNIELLSGDFGLPAERLTDIVTYMQRLRMVEIENENLRSARLETMLEPVIEKRLRMQKLYSAGVSAAETPVSDVETPQRKGEERKGEERKEILQTEEVVKAENSKTETTDDEAEKLHPCIQTLLTWAPQHQQWLRAPIKEFEIKKTELADQSITGELQKFARYYLYKSRGHVSARFESDPVDFLRANWREWLNNIVQRRAEKAAAAKPARQKEEATFSPDEAYAIAYAVCGATADEFGKRLYRVQTAPTREEARERAAAISKEISSGGSGHTRTGPVSMNSIIN